MEDTLQGRVARAEEVIGYSFKNKLIAWEALHVPKSGVTHSGTRLIVDGNKRLAQIGDKAADLILAHVWYPTHDARGMSLACTRSFSMRQY